MKVKSIIEILNDVSTGKIQPIDAQIQIMNLLDLNKRKNDDKFIGNICLSYRHDFGLMLDEDREKLIFEAKEWIRSIINNLPYD